MQFVDEATIDVAAGDGGRGAVAFRREKFVPLGGPAGGDGGRGGDVIFVAKSGMTTLYDLRYRQTITAQKGENGRGKDQYGKAGKDTLVRVPLGTQIFNRETNELIADLNVPDEEVIIAKGGRGGRGNIHFATPSDRAPRRAEEGTPGQVRQLKLELKLLADVGIVGFPNVGKSSFIRAVSRARPKVADYPFTTLVPNLGVVSLGEDRNFVIADIPGIIEGASEGAGLGLRFLKHVERTRALLHIVTLDPDPGRDPWSDFEKLNRELANFNPEIAKRPMIVAMNKLDLPDARVAFDAFRSAAATRDLRVFPLSVAAHEGIDEILHALEGLLVEASRG